MSLHATHKITINTDITQKGTRYLRFTSCCSACSFVKLLSGYFYQNNDWMSHCYVKQSTNGCCSYMHDTSRVGDIFNITKCKKNLRNRPGKQPVFQTGMKTSVIPLEPLALCASTNEW